MNKKILAVVMLLAAVFALAPSSSADTFCVTGCLDIDMYYHYLYGDGLHVSTVELMKAADDWNNDIPAPGFGVITTVQLLKLADEWSAGN